jgi:hypothetical protein
VRISQRLFFCLTWTSVKLSVIKGDSGTMKSMQVAIIVWFH